MSCCRLYRRAAIFWRKWSNEPLSRSMRFIASSVISNALNPASRFLKSMSGNIVSFMRICTVSNAKSVIVRKDLTSSCNTAFNAPHPINRASGFRFRGTRSHLVLRMYNVISWMP
ncbi:MAG: hypothetical protein BWX80_02575 [Candidatus Hydrogenedentes bacterium ADurb.Bin101]|nr:MAG: hypothetical protein BWX80_02575 [Candidatus Hydrogenedentes bacterium ADurb.Bin101]